MLRSYVEELGTNTVVELFISNHHTFWMILSLFLCFIEDRQAEFMLKSGSTPKPGLMVSWKWCVWNSYVLVGKWSAQWTLHTLKVSAKWGVLTGPASGFYRIHPEWLSSKYHQISRQSLLITQSSCTVIQLPFSSRMSEISPGQVSTLFNSSLRKHDVFSWIKRNIFFGKFIKRMLRRQLFSEAWGSSVTEILSPS